mmetsp:Transcript_51415/g.159430  ORF Transcript_51415/g.159430 Transcript_51415/m.159430 type:complete len:328 (-) Transcript_51415:229-1212(-)
MDRRESPREGPKDAPADPAEERPVEPVHREPDGNEHAPRGEEVELVVAQVDRAGQPALPPARVQVQEAAQVLVGGLPRVDVQPPLGRHAPIDLPEELGVALLVHVKPLAEAQEPVAREAHSRDHPQPAHLVGRLDLVDGWAARLEELGEGAAEERLGEGVEGAPRQRFHASVDRADHVDPREEEDCEPLHGTVSLGVAAPVEDQHLRVQAHVEDRPEQTLGTVKGHGVRAAAGYPLGQQLRGRVVEDLEVVRLLVANLQFACRRQPQPTVLGHRPVVGGQWMPDVKQELLAMVTTLIAQLEEGPRQRPCPHLRKTSNHHLDTRLVGW